MALIDEDGLFHGERLAACSDLAQLHWPRLFCAANGYARMELNSQTVSKVYRNFRNPLKVSEVFEIVRNLEENYLAVTYETGGSWWVQFITDEKRLKVYKTKADRMSPPPPPGLIDARLKEYEKKKKGANFGNFRKPSEHFPLGVGYGVGKGEGKSSVCNSASPAENAGLHTQANPPSLTPRVAVSVERERILNISSTRVINAPETEPSDPPWVEPDPNAVDTKPLAEYLTEARRFAAEQESRATQAIQGEVIAKPVHDGSAISFDDVRATFGEILLDSQMRPATSLDSTTSRVDKSHLRTETAEVEQNRDEKIAQNRPERDICVVNEATPYPEAQTSQDDGKARDGVARELPVETYQEQKGEVLPPEGNLLPGDRPDWVELILSLYVKGRHSGRAKAAVIDAITREVAQGRQANDAAAAAWLFERTQCFTQDFYPAWPDHERKYLWDAAQFFNDGHYADDASTWRRDAKPTAQQQRDLDTEAAVQRTLQRLGSGRSNHPSLPTPRAPEQPDVKRGSTSIVRASLGGFATSGLGHSFRTR